MLQRCNDPRDELRLIKAESEEWATRVKRARDARNPTCRDTATELYDMISNTAGPEEQRALNSIDYWKHIRSLVRALHHPREIEIQRNDTEKDRNHASRILSRISYSRFAVQHSRGFDIINNRSYTMAPGEPGVPPYEPPVRPPKKPWEILKGCP